MLDYTKEDLQELGAEITTREIYQQPSVWKETARLYQERKAEIKAFLEKIGQEHDYIKVILTGAGTSAYVGDTLVPYLQEVHDERHWNFQSIATTDIVAHPQTYLKKRGSDDFSIFCPEWQFARKCRNRAVGPRLGR